MMMTQRETTTTNRPSPTSDASSTSSDFVGCDASFTSPEASVGLRCWATGRDDLFEIQKNQIARKIQDTIEDYNDCFRCLQQEMADLKLIREENLNLRSLNLELSLMLSDKENLPPVPSTGQFSPIGGRGTEASEDELLLRSLFAGFGESSVEGRSGGRKAVAASLGGSKGGSAAVGVVKPLQRVLLTTSGQEGGEEEEVEVYEQGMYKTELCNKWEEMGECPYGNKCQFAHGLHELRPVIRHPRYKTQPCRMLSSPTGCPYGHRCHFRHSSHRQQPMQNFR
ncbi:Zinc finger CCCH domain-containing protein 15 [Acorus calamus]|uniref:Zinc finger CCCH domain-containing protein 15 n=1 Tax=Acorus calamus TaxID=4465 RepID=A0AAV9D282_ACOCL|nr:Zinc finger CCCH domain-containing protein 15 [Acorus calamus]